VNLELPLDGIGEDLDELVARIDAILDENFMREVDAALERYSQAGDPELVIEPLAG
jgi:hypothetical protein